MPFPDERGILIKDPWGERPLVTTAVPGVPLASLAQASVQWLRTCQRNAVTLSTGNVMVTVSRGMTEHDVCMAFTRAKTPQEKPPAETPTIVSIPDRAEPALPETGRAWDIRAFVDSRLC